MTKLTRILPLRPLGLVFLCFLGLSANAQDVPFLGGRVNDYAGMLSSSSVSELGWLLRSHEDSTSNQVVILTINTLNGASLEEYSIKVAQTWKLGQKGKDNGVLLLIVKDDRKMRIEVGYGFEGVLTDALSSVIIQSEIIPKFKKGDYDGGIRAGTMAILGVLKGTYAPEERSDTRMDLGDMILFLGVFCVVVGLFTLIGIFSKGPQSWFLYVFLIPFWLAFPWAAIGGTLGLLPALIYIVGFPIAKIWLAKSPSGKHFQETGIGAFLASAYARGGSSSGGGWSSGGGSFSGGGGSFGGGGSSGSW